MYPLLKAVGESLAEAINWCKAGFKPEENITYLADGVIKLFSLKNLEVLLLETSSCFGCTDRSKNQL